MAYHPSIVPRSENLSKSEKPARCYVFRWTFVIIHPYSMSYWSRKFPWGHTGPEICVTSMEKIPSFRWGDMAKGWCRGAESICSKSGEPCALRVESRGNRTRRTARNWTILYRLITYYLIFTFVGRFEKGKFLLAIFPAKEERYHGMNMLFTQG